MRVWSGDHKYCIRNTKAHLSNHCWCIFPVSKSYYGLKCICALISLERCAVHVYKKRMVGSLAAVNSQHIHKHGATQTDKKKRNPLALKPLPASWIYNGAIMKDEIGVCLFCYVLFLSWKNQRVHAWVAIVEAKKMEGSWNASSGSDIFESIKLLYYYALFLCCCWCCRVVVVSLFVLLAIICAGADEAVLWRCTLLPWQGGATRPSAGPLQRPISIWSHTCSQLIERWAPSPIISWEHEAHLRMWSDTCGGRWSGPALGRAAPPRHESNVHRFW